MAHRDGWFDASGDNASGVASMIGLAEHYSKIPQAQRKRTMIFIGLDGHHNSGEGSAVGNQWIIDNRQKLFAKTAVAINVEHPSTIQTQSRPRYYNANEIVWGNTYMPQQWYAGGPSRPELQKIATAAFKQFGATMDLFPNPTPPASDMSSFFRFLPGDRHGRIPSLFPHRSGDAADGAVDRFGSFDACLREDHRRSEQAAVEHISAARGADADPPVAFARTRRAAASGQR